MIETIKEKVDLKRRIPEIDGLRGLAIIGVLVCHFFGQGIDHEQSHRLASYLAELALFGGSGVSLFFVLSGFLIAGILLDNKNSPNYFSTFYLRRSFRILPAYYFLIFLIYVLNVLSAQGILNIPGWIIGFTFSGKYYLTFTQNFAMVGTGNFGLVSLAHTWSLAVEEQFYLTLPFIIRFAPARVLQLLVLALFCSAPVFRGFMATQTNDEFLIKALAPANLDFLMMGVAIAIVFRSKRGFEILSRYRFKLIFPLFFGLLFGVLGMQAILQQTFPTSQLNPLVLGYTVLCLICGLLVLSAVLTNQNSYLSKILSTSFLRKMGELSYFIYLFHILVYCLVHWQFGLFEKPPFGFVYLLEMTITLSIILVLAQISWTFFEKPLINYGHRFNYFDKSVEND